MGQSSFSFNTISPYIFTFIFLCSFQKPYLITKSDIFSGKLAQKNNGHFLVLVDYPQNARNISYIMTLYRVYYSS